MLQNKLNILVIDDDHDILLSLETFLQRHFNLVVCCKKPDAAIKHLEKNEFHVILLDMNFASKRMNGNEGFFWMQEIRKITTDVSIVFITAYADVELAVRAMKEGAVDFVEKPWKNQKLLATLKSAAELTLSKNKLNTLKEGNKLLISGQGGVDMLKGKSLVMDKIWKIVDKAAPSDANILILGENGTGKELVARGIHQQSARKDEMFVKVDMGAIPESLFESEMFGYMRGAFTDARENKPGRFEIASGGTLFLDEIGNMPIAMQAKILSVIQNKEIFRVGGSKPVPIDVRIISATNMNLDNMISQKLFREDLFYRLNTVTMNLPSLKERNEDIPLFADFFLKRFRSKYNKNYLKISSKAMRILQKYNWPGNIRQLEHCIENAVILSESGIIGEDDLHLSTAAKTEQNPSNYYDNEKLLINKTIQKAEGNLSVAAKELGIARTTLYRKIKKHEL